MSGPDDDHRSFPFPLSITTFSNTIVTCWAIAFSRIRRFHPQPLTSEQFRKYVLPIGATTALEIGFSNVALYLLTVSFGTILKGGSPVFTLIWGILLGVEMFSCSLTLSVLVIAGGIMLASFGEGTDFVPLGFALQLGATALGGFRWAMTQVLLRGSPENKMPPLTATLYTSPTTAACVLPFALALEARQVASYVSKLAFSELFRILIIMLLIATLVFVLLISEYWLVHDTSSLALSVAGIFKECMTIGGGLVLFNERLSLLNIIGFVICQAGIIAYICLRYDPDADEESIGLAFEAVEGTDIPLTAFSLGADTDAFVDDRDNFESNIEQVRPMLSAGPTGKV